MANLRKTFGKLTIPLLVLLTISFSALPAQAKYGGGTGEPNDPYLIYDANQMNAIGADSNDWDKHFKLMADIDLTGYSGTSFNIIGYFVRWYLPDNKPFTGTFDGNGKNISNFSCTCTDTNARGLFGYVGDPNAEIKDLRLIAPDVNAGTGEYIGSLVGWIDNGTITNCYVEGGSVTGMIYVGELVGTNVRGTISNSYSTGSVSGGWCLGGLVGENQYDGTITNCYSEADVSGTWFTDGGLVGMNWGTITNCYSTGSVSGTVNIGGLVGNNWGTITNCYAEGNASGNARVGGLVGSIREGTISNCYATSSVSVRYYYVGGLVGYNHRYPNVLFLDSFWDIQTSGQTTSVGGWGKTTAEMQILRTFTKAGWDFTTPVWTIHEGVDYPRLWWERPLLHAEPEVTLGASNTISWEPVLGANDYYAECAEDANFNSIIYNTDWITKTSYEFAGLEVGKRYWYSVKARKATGTETDWSNVESSLQGTLLDAVAVMLDPDTLKNKNMKSTLLNKIIAVQQMVDEGLYAEALDKLENDILRKTNGCGETGEPDKNDWIITCEGQSVVYPLIIETIEYVKGLMQ